MEPIKNSPFTRAGQVGAVVKDMDKVIDYYASLGIGPFGEPRQIITSHEYKGKTINTKAKFLLTNMGEVDFELIQPIEGPSVWQDFLEKKGEGLHHIGFFVKNIDEAEQNLVNQGLNIIQKGRSDKGGYAYFDTDRVGGVVFELIQKPEGVQIAKTKAEGNPFAVLHQAAAVVTDIDKAVEHYTSLGVGPFKPMKIEIVDKWVRRTPVQLKTKALITQIGPLELELLQPIEGPSVYWEYLKKTGSEGLQHLGFFIDNLEEESEKLFKKGVKPTQQGKGPSDAFDYFETDEIGGVVLEFVRRGPQD